jgi:hypothetical protein
MGNGYRTFDRAGRCPFYRSISPLSRVGGIKSTVVDGKTGFLIGPKNHDVLAHRLACVYRNPALGRPLALARRTGISRRTLNDIKHGARPSGKTQRAILATMHRQSVDDVREPLNDEVCKRIRTYGPARLAPESKVGRRTIYMLNGITFLGGPWRTTTQSKSSAPFGGGRSLKMARYLVSPVGAVIL